MLTAFHKYGVMPTPERFWRKVRKGSENDCWPWLGAKTSKGYGLIYAKRHIRVRATHVVLYFDGRPLPVGLQANHTCDNPSCVNPAHIYAGTPQSNVDDMIARGRFPKRIGNNRTGRRLTFAGGSKRRLTEQEVVAMRVACASGVKTSDISEAFDISPHFTARILRGASWPEAGGPIRPTGRRSRD